MTVMPTLSLIQNTNSYVATVADADMIVATNFRSTDAIYINWSNSTDDLKISALIASCTAMNKLKYIGGLSVRGQALAFPRNSSTIPGLIYLPYVAQQYDSTLIDGTMSGDGYDSAMIAQVTNAATGISMPSNITVNLIDRSIRGVRSRKIPTITETYDPPEEDLIWAKQGIYNWHQFRQILNGWLVNSISAM